jgi:ubiquinone/menaquinone biosynthesis C-methylase UbiE
VSADAEDEAATGVGWSQIADWYDALVRSGRSPHDLAVATTLALAGDVAGLRVLDVGCGQGAATRALAAAGAEVTGADLTPELVAAARRLEAAQPLGITYLESDAQQLAELPDAGFDLVTCQLALMDIPDLDATLAAVRRVLRPGGSFVAVISHPCFLAPFASTVDGDDGLPGRLVTRYLDEEFWRSPNPQGVRRAGAYHRTLSTYLNAFVRHGFTLEQALEPPAVGEHAREQPVYVRVPIFFAVRLRSGVTSGRR